MPDRPAEFAVFIRHEAALTDLPVPGPTRYQLGINLKTAKALSLTVSNEMKLPA